MTKIKGEIPVSYFPTKPVLNRKFTPPGKKTKPQRNQVAPYRGYEYQPEPLYPQPRFEPEPDMAPQPAPAPATPQESWPAPIEEPQPVPVTPPKPPAEVEGRRNWMKPQIQRR